MEYSFQDNQIQDRLQQHQLSISKNEAAIPENYQQIDNERSEQLHTIAQVLEYGQFYSSQDQVVVKIQSLKLQADFEIFTVAFSFLYDYNEAEENQKKKSFDFNQNICRQKRMSIQTQKTMSNIQIDQIYIVFKNKEREELKHIVQFGNNNRKLLQISIDPKSQYLCISYKRDLEYEYLYSQNKIKPQTVYHFQMTYLSQLVEGLIVYYINMYLNGVLQGQVIVTNPIKFVAKSLIFIGSESAEDLFKGKIGDFILSTEEMTIEMLKEIQDEKYKSREDFKYLPSIIDILGELEVKHEIGRQNSLLTLQNKHSVPNQLQKTHGPFIVEKHMKQQLAEKAKSLLQQYKDRRNPYEDLRDSLSRNNDLNIAMRQMSLNYRWIFTTLFAMSPSIDDGVGQKVPFFCLHTLIANGNIQVSENFPLFVIETTRFHRVLSYAKIKISKEQLEYLAEKAGCIKKYLFEQNLENNEMQKLKIEGIYYDRFMQMVRDICLTEYEINNVKQQCRVNPHQEEEDIEREKREWASVQNEFIKDNKKPMFVYNSIKHLQRVLKLKKVPEPFKESQNYKLVGFYLILPPFRSLTDVGYYNKFVQTLFEYRYQNDITNLFKTMCHGRLSRCEITLFHSFVIDKLQLDNSPAIEEIFKMLCISNPTSFNEKEFNFFINNWCIGSIYQHKGTGVQIYIDCFNQKYLEVDPSSKNLADQANQFSGPSIQNLAQLNQNSSNIGNNSANIANSIGGSHQSLQSLASPTASYFQYRVIIEEGEQIYGICGCEKDGYVDLETLKVITNKRKIQIAPLRYHRQFQNTIFYDKKVQPNNTTPTKGGQSNFGSNSLQVNTQLSPYSHTTASPSFQFKTNQSNVSPNNNNSSSKQLSFLAENPDDLDHSVFIKDIRKKSSTVVISKQQIQDDNQLNQDLTEQIKDPRTPNNPNAQQKGVSGSNTTTNSQNRHLTIATSYANGMLDKRTDSNSQNFQTQSISDRHIKLIESEKQEENLILYFEPSEMRKVTGFEILINQDHECPIRYQENQLMMNISSQKYLCRFSTLQLLSATIKSPKISMDFQNTNPTTLQQVGQPQSQSNTTRNQSQNAQLQIKQFSQISQQDQQFSSRPTQANTYPDQDQYNFTNDIGFSALQSQSAPISSSRKYTKTENYPVICNHWSQGKFQIIINHCTNCEYHSTTTWHEEADFCEKFNDLGLLLQNLFPNIEIIGNYEKPKIIETFEVYIRGVGPSEMRDSQGRISLYRKNESLKSFLLYFEQRMTKIFDGLILLSLSYADSSEMEKVQNDYLKKYESLLQPIWYQSHEYPCSVPDRPKQIEEEKKRENEILIGTAMICKNWACGKSYEYSDDPGQNKQCFHHPKPFDVGSVHGLWPESWSCCRGDWESKGCTRGHHKGYPEKKFYKLCINHGEMNPETQHPDSACGQLYLEAEQKFCRYHRGYFSKNIGQWTCCNEGYAVQGCHDDTHESVQWPNPSAKIYFVERQLLNPGLSRNLKPSTFEKSSLKSSVYRVTEQYKPYVTRKTQLQQERKVNENEIRICLNWGCEEKHMRFKEVDNIKERERRYKNCNYHPGYFDFGNLNKPGDGIISIAHQLQNSDTNQIHANAIRPHWTCCRKEWKAIGCKQTYHWGPVEETMAPLKHGRWPEINAMKYFKKQSSPHFKQKMGELVLTEDMARHYWYQFTFGKDYLPIAKIGELCDKFKLSWMALSEDLSYHFKYFDVLRGIAQKQLDNGNGIIERETFTKWWFTPLHQYPINV